MTKYPKWGVVRVKGPDFYILNPFGKFGMGEARNFKFGTLTNLGKSHLMDDKIPQKARGQGPGANF